MAFKYTLYTLMGTRKNGVTMAKPNPKRAYIKVLEFIAKNPGITMKDFEMWNGRESISWAYDYVNYFVNEGYALFNIIYSRTFNPKTKKFNTKHMRSIFITEKGLAKIKEAYEH